MFSMYIHFCSQQEISVFYLFTNGYQPEKLCITYCTVTFYVCTSPCTTRQEVKGLSGLNENANILLSHSAALIYLLGHSYIIITEPCQP